MADPALRRTFGWAIGAIGLVIGAAGIANAAPDDVAPSKIAPSNIAPSNIAPSNISPSSVALSDFAAPAASLAAAMCVAGPGADGHMAMTRGFEHAEQASARRDRLAVAALAAADDPRPVKAYLPLVFDLARGFSTVPTAVPPTSAPPTAVPPTAVAPTAAPTSPPAPTEPLPAPTAAASPPPATSLTYWKDIRPIINAECVTCHVAGGIGPFVLEGYGDVVAHDDELAYVIARKIMPPLPAVADGETPIDDPRVMAPEDRAKVLEWLAAGAPEGEASTAAPDGPKPPDAGPPDLTFDIGTDYRTKAGRLDDYRCFVIDPGFRRDTELRMVDVAPTNTRIYHHGILYLALAGDAAKLRQLEAEDPEPGYECFGGPGAGTGEWVTGEAAGKLTRPYPDGTAKVIPAGAKFVLQLHYNTINGQGTDRSKVLLWKAPRPVHRAPVDVRLVNFLFNIPAGNPKYAVTAEADVVAGGQSGGLLRVTAPEGKLWQVWGHMHMLGSSFTLDLVKPNGAKRRLLDIPDWAFNWQGVYDLVTPIDLKAGDRILMTCTWDNSPANQAFVDGKQLPPRAVRWGEGTLDEMCLGGVTVTK